MQSTQTIRTRREASRWTQIHPIFAIGQLGVFLVSAILLVLYFAHLVPFADVHLSVLVKVLLMAGAIVTGALWEHDVFDRWWFAQEFFIEDVMTANVFALHVGYLVTFYAWPNNPRLYLAMLCLAYLVYGLNVAQYIVSHVSTRKREEIAMQRQAGIAA